MATHLSDRMWQEMLATLQVHCYPNTISMKYVATFVTLSLSYIRQIMPDVNLAVMPLYHGHNILKT